MLDSLLLLVTTHDFTSLAKSPNFFGPLIPSTLFFLTVFHLLSTRFPAPKQLSWIITTVASAVMTILSLPFLYDYLTSAGSVRSVRTIPVLANATNRFFQAYLITDLIAGTIYYRTQISLLTGYIHHIVYIFIAETAIRRSWVHIFCLCACMEFPTFILGLSTLFPRLRSNVLFAVSFFATRIMLHVILCISYFLPHNRPGSYIPALLLAGVFPLHAMWFHGCIKGFLRRASMQSVAVSTRDVPASPAISAGEVLLASLQVGPTPKINVTRATLPARVEIGLRRPSLERIVRALRLGIQADAAAQRLQRARALGGSIYGRLPAREVVYDYVGLGRGDARAAGVDVDRRIGVF